MSDLIVGLIGIAAGWGLSQGTEVVKSCLHDKKLKRLLTQELKDIDVPLDERVLTFEKNVAEYRKSFLVVYCVPLNTPFLDTHYIEIADQLTDAQRYNIRNIQDQLTALNNGLLWLEQNIFSSPEKHGLSTTQIFTRIVNVYKAALYAQAILKECNKSGGQEAITDNHPSMIKVKEIISKIEI
ncbi:hypothetical protein [Marinomonas atlantica]|uniref:hypothetical protein n=1 Tax=Marinomonas atlantica TaxID=1806668 RepID=UPI000833429E|nr:hypothetical protein [Marinomonas atlantica]